jgi:hypothetical protein
MERMSAESSDYYKLKNSLKKEIYTVVDSKLQFMEKMGFRETQNKDFEKLTFKYSAIDQKENKLNFKISDSVFSMGLQRSDYLSIDNDLMYSLHLHPNKVNAMMNNNKTFKNNENDKFTGNDSIR